MLPIGAKIDVGTNVITGSKKAKNMANSNWHIIPCGMENMM